MEEKTYLAYLNEKCKVYNLYKSNHEKATRWNYSLRTFIKVVIIS